MGGHHAVGRTVSLARIELVVSLRRVIEHLKFTRADVSGVSRARITDCQPVVAAGGKPELKARDEVRELLFSVNRPAFARLANDGAVLDFVVISRAGPAVEVLSAEDRPEPFFAAPGQDSVGFLRRDLAEEDVTPADFAAVRLEFNRTFGWHGGLAIVVVLEYGMIDHKFVVEPHAHA